MTKLVSFVLFVLYTYFTACDLTRGPIVWILTGIIVFELFDYCERNSTAKISPKTMVVLFAAFVAALVSFDVFGSMRTASMFDSISSHYQMKVSVPAGFTWIYIYITTPLENARYALESIAVHAPTIGSYLFYPIIKLLTNIVGMDGGFTAWLSSSTSIYPYLQALSGLNVGSFLMDALQDFSYVGIPIYVTCYGVVSFVLKRILEQPSIATYTKLIVYALIIQEPLWSIFDNMVVSGVLWICAALFIGIDFVTTLLSSNRAPSPRGNSMSRLYLD